jgi:membrane protein YqaA with SNARE-associated domain
MSNHKDSDSFSLQKKNQINSRTKTLIFALQIMLVATLLIIWLSSTSIRSSKSLWVLFFYSFPSEFLIAVVPHEPILIYFGKFYTPFTVAAVAIISTLLTEALNYSTFKYITDTQFFQKVSHKKTVTKIIKLFQKSPFLAIWIAGFTPIPFYPFRFLVVLARYPLVRYLLALFLSRTPRFCILAYLGHAINIPDYLLIALFVVLIASMNVNFLRKILKRDRNKKEDNS